MARIIVVVMRLPPLVAEAVTLPTGIRSDKRTKEVFTLYLERVNPPSGTALRPSSTAWMIDDDGDGLNFFGARCEQE
jgi:hypothetical protein